MILATFCGGFGFIWGWFEFDSGRASGVGFIWLGCRLVVVVGLGW